MDRRLDACEKEGQNSLFLTVKNLFETSIWASQKAVFRIHFSLRQGP